jgi:hypothetical protein
VAAAAEIGTMKSRLAGVDVIMATRDRLELLDRPYKACDQDYRRDRIVVVFGQSQAVDDLGPAATAGRSSSCKNRTPGWQARSTGILAAADLVAFCVATTSGWKEASHQVGVMSDMDAGAGAIRIRRGQGSETAFPSNRSDH